jgi:glycosyltransferase involved in cell wall biosynthesis
MKKIVFTVTNDLTYDQRMHRICNSLTAAGYDCTLVGFLKKNSVPLTEKTFKHKRLKVYFKRGKLFYLEYNIRLFFWLVFNPFDIYCGIDLDTLLPVYLNGKFKRKPVVHDAHEYFTELPEIVDRPLVKNAWLMLEKFLLPRIHWNYTVGGIIAHVLSSKYNRQYAVIRNVPVLQPETVAQNEQKNAIIYQGALNKGRGIENLLLAMEHIDAELLIAGEGDLSNSLRELASTLAHKHKIRFLGYVEPDALKILTQQAKVGVNFVENMGLSYYYSLSNKFFDYIHAGVPQVTMQYPEYKALNDVYDIAVLVEDIQIETITKAINDILQDTALYTRLKKNTLRAKMELNWQKEEITLRAFYRNIG